MEIVIEPSINLLYELGCCVIDCGFCAWDCEDCTDCKDWCVIDFK